MAAKGKTLYIPPFIIDEIEDIKREDSVHQNIDAMGKLVKYARVGREVKRMMRLDWSKSVKLPKVEDYLNKK